MMKNFKFLFAFIVTVLSAGNLYCQVGNGVLFLTESSYTFPGTTVDSLSTFEIQVKNELAVSQTVYFGALDAPFSLVDNSPVEIPADDTVTVTLQFQPTLVGEFSAVFSAVGGVFGSAEMNVSGNGIQVVLEWTQESLIFDTTAIGQSNAQVVSIASSGNGDGLISAIEFSNPIFSVDSAASAFSIPEGTSAELTFVFAPIDAGYQTGTATLHTNDPNNAQIVLDLSGAGISELQGTYCDLILNESNSPYILVGDITVEQGCHLIIEENTTFNLNGYTMTVNGDLVCEEGVYLAGDEGVLNAHGVFQLNGNQSNKVQVESLNLNAQGPVNMEYTEWDPNSVGTGFYSQDFSENSNGWSKYSPQYSYGPPSEQHLRIFYEYNGTGDWNWYFTSPTFNLDNVGYVGNVSFKLTEYYYSQYNNHTPRLEFQINGGPWTQGDYVFESREINTWYEEEYNIPLSFENVSSFRFRLYFQDFGGMNNTLDDVSIGISSTHNYSDVTPSSTIYFDDNLYVDHSSIGSFSSGGDSVIITNSQLKSVSSFGESAVVECLRSDFSNNGLAHGLICIGGNSSIYAEHCRFANCLAGLLNGPGSLQLQNSSVLQSVDYGVKSLGPIDLNFCSLAFNGGTGLDLSGDNFHSLNNSILWGNNTVSFTQIKNGGGVISTSYSTVQGKSGYGVTGAGQFYWGAGVIEADPLFADDDLHLNTYSPCVDGGQPWLIDAHMPYGLGGVRADMGMYGGPDNAYWGGLALPDGVSSLLTVQDSPQDQGNSVGLTFSSSFYDNSELVNNVTHYAFWRHFDPTGAPITDVAEGNWELLGEMPSLSLSNYAYQAPTLGNTNAFGDFSSCYFVAAHTADDDTYWISNVMCGESVDNLAPDDPDLNGLVLETGEAQISWTPPTEEDYAYTEIYNDDGFTAEVGNDTLVVDPSVVPGSSYTYTAVNYDVNGNASDPSTLTLDIPAGLDIIPLVAGWNLISTDRSPIDASVEAVFASLNPGNLDYITGFDAGVQFYDPDGLAFLNSLTELTSGHGYWVRVNTADTLEIAGASIPANSIPVLNAGWNLIGYPNAMATSPADYFADFMADDALIYVTGFDGGSSYFDPNGLPFLNSLTALENGFGYWIKVTEAYDPNGMVLAGDEPIAALSGASTAQPNPNFMLVNGTSDLTEAAGEYVEVLASGRGVGRLPILEGGYLMTTALFGDDPATPAVEGLEPGTALEFQFRGARADQTIDYTGSMDLRQLALTFGASATALDVFPNPFTESLQIAVELPHQGRIACQLTDATGRVVAERAAEMHAAGTVSLIWNVPGLAPGMYTCQVVLDGKVWSTVPLVRVD